MGMANEKFSTLNTMPFENVLILNTFTFAFALFSTTLLLLLLLFTATFH